MSTPTLPKPAPCQVLAENIPQELKDRPQWVCWRWEWKDPTGKAAGKWDKPPYDPKTGWHARSNDPATWASFDVAWAAYCDPTNNYSGIGYTFSGQPGDFAGIDLDDCRAPLTGEIRPWTPEQRACEHWADMAPEPAAIIECLRTYAEVSPSGSGVKLILRGELKGGMKRGDIEMYCSGRYFTVTGHRLPGCLTTIEKSDILWYLQLLFSAKATTAKAAPQRRQKSTKAKVQVSAKVPTTELVIEACQKAENSDKFSRLFDGDTNGYPSQSEADAALCAIIAFWSAGDRGVVDQVFRQSKLMRDKWDEDRGSETYGQRTIRTVLETCTEFFDWNKVYTAPITVGCLTLVVKKVRRTAAKITVQVEVQNEGRPIDLIKLTDAAASRKDAIKAIVARIPGEPDAANKASEALGQILVDAACHEERGTSECKEIHEILAEHVPGQMEFQYATNDGKAFSGILGRPFSRSQFIDWFTNPTVVALTSSAVDAPRDENDDVVRLRLIGAIKRELEVLWGELFSRLGTPADVELADDSPAAVEFREAIVKAWSKLVNMGIHKQEARVAGKPDKGGEISVQLATRNSLATRVQKHLAENTKPTGRWVPVQTGFDAYFRVQSGPTAGEFRILLAMNFKLAAEVGVTFPCAVDQKSLNRIGVKFGAFQENPSIPNRMTGGRTLSVLSAALVEDILAVPLEDTEGSLPNDSEDRSATSDDQSLTNREPDQHTFSGSEPNDQFTASLS